MRADIKLCRHCADCGQLAKLDYMRDAYCRPCMTQRAAKLAIEMSREWWIDDGVERLRKERGVDPRIGRRFCEVCWERCHR